MHIFKVFVLAGLSPAIVTWRRAPNKMAKNEVPPQNFPPQRRIAPCKCIYLCVYLQYVYMSDVLSGRYVYISSRTESLCLYILYNRSGAYQTIQDYSEPQYGRCDGELNQPLT